MAIDFPNHLRVLIGHFVVLGRYFSYTSGAPKLIVPRLITGYEWQTKLLNTNNKSCRIEIQLSFR